MTEMLLGQNLPSRLHITSSRVQVASWLVFALILGLANVATSQPPSPYPSSCHAKRHLNNLWTPLTGTTS
ncbi:hypothetical protein Pmani_014410 [Petrolisthes manimaculis]|uniref:Uncharacterized protein n=1 Tax=Petrolisthes manimaculis TaxID=1843537 RepID=A0AAE1UAY5_9EUCA|nr:hypothetical protein Pmani_014410 [Petrolisthes manimaculis]